MITFRAGAQEYFLPDDISPLFALRYFQNFCESDGIGLKDNFGAGVSQLLVS
ncbi:hypothetical protein [Candidatus Kryptonium thompsonii]|uniref:hypothetical protein n=1 Tax=Candidatus Kryptonium thompsonii TaxID=1633631 RepID=UPI0013520DC1|nr:hypothetical protein [Candidatus Kryptonium thompsoni]